MKWNYDMQSAPTDGTIIRLLVDYNYRACPGHHSLFDKSVAQTIGFNNDSNVGGPESDDAQGWQFAGWDWCNDVFTQGIGTPVAWLYLDEPEEQS